MFLCLSPKAWREQAVSRFPMRRDGGGALFPLVWLGLFFCFFPQNTHTLFSVFPHEGRDARFHSSQASVLSKCTTHCFETQGPCGWPRHHDLFHCGDMCTGGTVRFMGNLLVAQHQSRHGCPTAQRMSSYHWWENSQSHLRMSLNRRLKMTKSGAQVLTQWIKYLLEKPDDQSSIPRS